MDDADLGNKAATWHLRHTIEQIRTAGHPARDSFAECVDCGEEIPDARRRAVPGCRRCVTCKAAQEGKGRRG